MVIGSVVVLGAIFVCIYVVIGIAFLIYFGLEARRVLKAQRAKGKD